MSLIQEIIENNNVIINSIKGCNEEHLRKNTQFLKIKPRGNAQHENNHSEHIRDKNYFEIIKNQDLILNSGCCPIMASKKFLLYEDTRSNHSINDRINEWKAVGSNLSENIIEANDNDFFIYGCTNFGHFIHEDLSRALLIGKFQFVKPTKTLQGLNRYLQCK